MRHASASASSGSVASGFTLIEVLTVLILIGLVTGFVASSWGRFTERIRARSHSDELMEGILLARSDAMARMRLSGIAIDTAARRYIRFVDSDSVGVLGRYDEGVDSVLAPWIKLDTQLVIREADCSEMGSGTAHVVFSADGTSLSQLSLLLGARRGGFAARIFLLPATGLATMEVL